MKDMEKEYEFKAMSDGVTVVRYLGKSKHVKVPERLNGMPVVGVTAQAFTGTTMQTLDFPDSLKRLELDAISECEELVEISLPGSISEIGGCISYGAPKLRTFVLRGQALSPACIKAISCLNAVQVLQIYTAGGVEAWLSLTMNCISG